MNTKTIALPGVKQVMVYALGVALIASSFFAVSVPRAHAAQLTEPQIQAVLNLLIAFNVPAATVANVNVILHKRN